MNHLSNLKYLLAALLLLVLATIITVWQLDFDHEYIQIWLPMLLAAGIGIGALAMHINHMYQAYQSIPVSVTTGAEIVDEHNLKEQYDHLDNDGSDNRMLV